MSSLLRFILIGYCLVVPALAQNLSTVINPPSEAPGLTQAAQAMLAKVNKRVLQIDTADLAVLLKKQPHTVVLDVRTPNELNMFGGYIDAPRFFNLTRGWLEFQIEAAVPDKTTPRIFPRFN